MGAFTYIETDTGTNVDISAATAVGAYTSTGDKLIMVDVSIDAVAGNGDYVMYVTRKIGGSGSAYRILPQTTMAAASGLTAISAQSGWITVRNGDVLTCYVDGLAGDTSTPDWSTRWFELAGVTAAAVADAVWDEATADHTSAGSLSKAVADILTDTGTTLDGKIDTIDGNVDAILADTGTDGVVLAGVTAAAVADIVWEEAIANHTSAGSLGKAVADILTDTGTDGVKIADDAITAAKFDESTAFPLKSADTGATAVARTGADSDTLETLSDQMDATALEATLTAIKGAGWSTETLAAIDVLIDAIKAKTDLIPASPAEAGEYTAAIAAVKSVADDILVDTGTTLDALIKDIPTNAELATALGTADDAVLAAVAAAKVVIDDIHDTDLPAVKTDTAAVKAKTDQLAFTVANQVDANALTGGGSGATAQEVWEYATRVLTAGTNIDLSALATAADLATLDDKVDTVDGILDDLHDTDIPAILEDTGTTLPATLATIAGYTDGIAGDVWSHAKRTLTVPAVAMSDPNDPTTLMLYRDADINIEFTGLIIPTGAKKVVFTIKDNLDDADTAAALQATYELTAVPAETHTLNYINSAVPPTLTTPVTFTVTTDSVEFDMTAAAAYLLPRYERGYLNWDLKLITATSVQILQQGLVQILGTSTRTVA